MDNTNRLFRKAVIGGFNKDDVIDYIESMKNEFFEYRKQVETTIADLNQKIAELEEAARNTVIQTEAVPEKEHVFDKPKPIESDFQNNFNFSLGEINAATDHLKKTADKLCDNLTEFMDRISSNCISVTVKAPIREADNNDKPIEETTGDSIDLTGNEAADADKPSDEEIAAAYQQAIRIKGDSILSDTFKADGNDSASSEDDSQKKSSFSQLLDSILSTGVKPSATTTEEKKEERSILDDLLTSSSFIS